MPPGPVVRKNREKYSEGPTGISVGELQRLVWRQMKKKAIEV